MAVRNGVIGRTRHAGGVAMRGREELAAGLLLLSFALGCLSFAWTTSPVFDEPGLVYAGYADLKTGAPKIQTGHPILARAWAALPLLLMNPSIPTDAELREIEPGQRELGRLFVFHRANDWRAVLRSSRLMIIALGLGLCVAVYLWSRRLFGPVGALISLALCCWSPVVLSNSAVATTDLAVSLCFLLALRSWWSRLHRVSAGTLLASGISLGLLLATKASGLLFGPVLLILVGVRLAARRDVEVRPPHSVPRTLPLGGSGLWAVLGGGTAAAFLAVATIWAAYAWPAAVFHRDGLRLSWDQAFANAPGGVGASIVTALHESHLLPDRYLFELRLVEATTALRRGFLLGDYSLVGWWYFFPVAMWFKTPIAAMALLAMGVAALCREALRGRLRAVPPGDRATCRAYELTPLIVLATVYLLASMTSGLNIGIRHVLPVYPVLFILSGAAALPPFGSRWGRGLVLVLVLWAGLEAWRVSPEYLAYFNQFAGGAASGHRILVDSSFEWGQDLPAVERWLARRRDRPEPWAPVYFSYFGNADLRRFVATDVILLPQEYELRPAAVYALKPGTYIISATMLHSVYGPVMGPWRPRYEEAYQRLDPQMRQAVARAGNGDAPHRPTDRDDARLSSAIRLWDALRFSRLCAYLRHRPPDGRITYGMLVFELSEQDLRNALEGPPAELVAGVAIRGTEGMDPGALDFLN
jgi:Dolichyl-phosphate-mannose-protein mannosyltransferase